jgi:hypothetical protein
MRFKNIKILAPALCLIAVITAFAGEGSDTDLKPVSIATFKNGLAFVVREGSVKLASGEAKIPFVPMATLGSLWVAPNDPGASIEELVVYRYDETKRGPADSVAQLLAANPGKVVTVTYGNKEYTGEIAGLRDSEKMEVPGIGSEIALRPVVVQPEQQFLLLKSEGKLVALSLGGIGTVSFPADAILRVDHTEMMKALRLKLKGAGDHAKLTMGYLEKGMGWTPSYLVSLNDEKTAELTLQAVVTNDAEDIVNADVFFVVGVPNFAYADIPSPMALEQSLAELMKDEEGGMGARRNNFSNALMGQFQAGIGVGSAGGMGSGAPGTSGDFSSVVSDLVGAPKEDLFLYSHGGTTLKRGERATYNVFSASATIEHIYEWNIPDTSRVDAFNNVQNNATSENTPGGSALNSVWHSLRLKNSTKFPWTSAPGLVISGTKPVAQDTLPYTPRGASSTLRLTVATGVRASQQELEVDRKLSVPLHSSNNFDLVTVEGILKLENYKSKDVHLLIHKSLRGEVTSLANDGKAEKIAHGIASDNPASLITWDLTLKAGAKEEITYRYKVFVRR